ncbi:MAG TPA: hypothetical protein VHX38_02995 [Pseudonocardiaceae bacterium]|jgi:hypothetical protein|nr:hypothetical protein [Pseudonocardiaceae bacterium]
MANDDVLYMELTAQEDSVIDALKTAEGIEHDAAKAMWDDGTIENAANAAASELGDLLTAIQARRDQIPAANGVT